MKNNVIKTKLKKLILTIKERIYFKDVKKVKYDVSNLIIPLENTNISLDKASYQEYYIKYKKNDYKKLA